MNFFYKQQLLYTLNYVEFSSLQAKNQFTSLIQQLVNYY